MQYVASNIRECTLNSAPLRCKLYLVEPYIALSCPRGMRSRQQERTDLFIFSFSMLHEIFIDYDLLPSVIFRFSGSDFREERARMSVDTSRSAVFVCKRLRIALFRTHMLVV